MLNLGQIRFGLGVDTRDLDQAVRRVQNFGRVVDASARAVGANARTIEAQLRRQEQASTRALQQVLNLNQAARRMNIPTDVIDRTNAAFDVLASRMTRGRLSNLQFQRTMIDFNRQMSESSRIITAFKPTPPGAELKVWMQDIASAAVLAGGPLSGLGARITAISAIVGRSSIALAAFTAGMTAAGVGIYKLSAGAVETSMKLQQVRVRLNALNQSTTESKVEYANLQQLADRTGVSFVTLADAYTRAKAASTGTALEGDKLREVFENLAIASAKFGLSQSEFEGTMKAVEQMISKGTVQAEELRGQMGDRLVGAFNAAAASMGVTTKQLGDMMKKGQILTSEFLVPFSREVLKRLGGDSTTAVETLRASIGRLGNAVLNFQDTFDQTFGVSQAFQNVVERLGKAIEYVTANITTFTAAVAGVAVGLAALALPAIIGLFGSLARAIVMATAAMAGLNGTMATNPVLGLIMLITRLAIATGIGAAAFAYLDQAMSRNGQATQNLITNVDEYIKSQEGAKTAVRSTTKTLIEEVTKQIQAAKVQLQAIRTLQAGTARMVNMGNKGNRLDQTGDPFSDKLRARFGQPPKGLTDFFGITDASQTAAEKFKSWDQETNTLTSSLDKLEAQLKQLNEIAKKPETGSNIPKMDTTKADTEAQIRRKAKALRESGQAIQDVQDDINAMRMGPGFFEEWKKMDEINDKVSQFRDRLKDAGIGLTTIDELAGKYRDTLLTYQQVVDGPFAAATEAFNTFKDATQNAFQGVAQAMAQAVTTGEFSAQQFIDIVTQMVQKIIEQLLMLAVMNPIMNSMFPGSNLPAFFDFGAKGMAFAGGVKKMAKGDILNGPTLFSHKGGMAVGGEAGTEAVMPLTRDSSGNLGVRTVGGRDAGDVNVMIFNRAPVKVKTREQGRGSNRNLILEIDEINAGLIASGNSRTSAAMSRRGAPPAQNLRT